MRPPAQLRPVAVTVAVAAALAAAGCGSGSGSGAGSTSRTAGALAWTAAPQVFRTKALPDDRIVVGTVRNTSGRPLKLDASALKVRLPDGRRLVTTGQFAAGYAHGLYGAFQKPDPIPPGELSRLGIEVTIAPGKTAPLAVSWHQPRTLGGRPVVDYGAGRLTLPTRVRLGEG
ncbi:hypothetical protein NBH00_15935 [Paraconexibacter antarcticus]|uniref:DUF4232 domain-containing protein n=1 Tax=Paraconexibacter antarcticus TaxID=2949664 RepID=A0ABY5DMM2_9ACTN|nr:hypothetical protein [Paraconexibacter antarcticus]UTI62846.1 hypothetical protein NBH00_15935 [Paraconexibacter antarcticus]